ncbi:hypothetical protein SO802_032312 [Lithocarpus litseifolius]|uniref:Uncharacterized protein n=1 Tax=Lithocarpus litseifolius TaxID=425828 RepID=A0AAW2BMS1_9ROSI
MILICLVATGVAKTAGSIFMVFSGPVLVLAFLSIAYLIIFREAELQERKASTKPTFFLWTFPVIVDGLFGDVSATKLIGIFLFVVLALGLHVTLVGLRSSIRRLMKERLAGIGKMG